MSLRTPVRRFHARQWRSLSTSTEPTAYSPPSRPRGPPVERTPGSKTWFPEENLRSLHPRMIFVRPWDGIPSMAHAFAIIREIERRFGKIQEFVVLRDSDVLTSNMPYMNATFARAEHADAIPLEGRVIQVAAPPTNPLRNGGVGLDDLEIYLDPEARAEALSGKGERVKEDSEGESNNERQGRLPQGFDGRIMDIKLERSGMRDPPSALASRLGSVRSSGPPHLRNPVRARELAEAMLAFGGFAEAPNEPGQGRTRMQAAMARWGRTAGSAAKPQPPRESDSPAEVVSPVDEAEWTPFAVDQASPSSFDPSPTPPSSALPPVPPPPSSLVSPSSPPPKPKPKPKLQPAPQPAAPQLSKKQRILLAARSAGAVAAAKNDMGSLDTSAAEALVSKGRVAASGTSDTRTEPPRPPESKDSVTREEENKKAARKWWNFLTGDKG